jgi:hypothetical protein
MFYLSKHLNFTFTEFPQHELVRHSLHELQVHDFMSEKEANRPLFRNLADIFCSEFDIVLVADTNPDARFLLQRIDREPHTCGIKKLIMITTNRFDYFNDLPSDEGDSMVPYRNLIIRVSNRRVGPEMIWIANNPWEAPYAEFKLRGKYLNVKRSNFLAIMMMIGVGECEVFCLITFFPSTQ